MIIRRKSRLMGLNQSVYPTSHNDTYVKSTTKWDTRYWPYYATDPGKSLTGTDDNNSWDSADKSVTNQRFHIDLGSMKIIGKIYYENYHNSGADVNTGCKNFTLQGSNSAAAFAELTYATDTDWVNIITGQLSQHSSSDQADPKYIIVSPPSQAFRYFAFKFSDNWGNTSWMGIRRLTLQENY